MMGRLLLFYSLTSVQPVVLVVVFGVKFVVYAVFFVTVQKVVRVPFFFFVSCETCSALLNNF